MVNNWEVRELKCPQCNNEMKFKNKSYMFTPFCTGVVDDYIDELYVDERYNCKDCNIKLNIKGEDSLYNKPEYLWTIPEAFIPTEKQLNCIYVINNKLGLKFIPTTKKKCCEFIKENIEASKNRNNCYENNFDDINYFNDVWCEHY